MEYLTILLCSVIVLASFVFCGLRVSLSSKIYFYIFMVICSLVFAFRPFYFPDTLAYYIAYADVDRYAYDIDFFTREPYSGMEYGYVYMMLFFKELGCNFEVFSFIVSLFSISTFWVWTIRFVQYLGIKNFLNDKSFLLPLIIFFMIVGLEYNLVQIRTLLALSISLWGVMYFFEKKIVYAIFFMCIGFFIHRMVIILVIPFMMLYCNKWVIPRRFFILIWFISLLFMLLERNYGLLFDSSTLFLFNILGEGLGIDYNAYNVFADSGLAKTYALFNIWINGYVFFKIKGENAFYTGFLLIYSMILVLIASLCRLEAVMRIVSVFSIWLIPLNVYCFYKWNKNRYYRWIFFMSLLFGYLLLPVRMFIFHL